MTRCELRRPVTGGDSYSLFNGHEERLERLEQVDFSKLGRLLLLTYMAFIAINVKAQEFELAQRRYENVEIAAREKDASLRQLFESKDLSYPPKRIFLRAFKIERVLELWAASALGARYHLVKKYDFCSSSGVLGPKRKEGDKQIPEGLYYVNVFNPESRYFLSLGTNYPNRSDRIKGDPNNPGSAIFIHGSCVTIGCIPITDELIKEVYWLAVQAKSRGQNRIPVHIFPGTMDQAGWSELLQEYTNHEDLIAFWENIRPAFDYFEQSRRPPTFTIDSDGEYIVPGSSDEPLLLKLQVPHLWGEDVEKVQQALVDKMYTVTVDGTYGPATAAAIRLFQGREGLLVDGIVGQATRTRLGLR